MQFLIMSLLMLSMACTDERNPAAPDAFPAGKITSYGPLAPPSAIVWQCGDDPVWSVFNGAFSFNIDGEEIAVREINKTHRQHDAALLREDGVCSLNSGFISSDEVVRIWKGRVWRDSYYKYHLQSNGESFAINRRYLSSDGTLNPPAEIVWYRDFFDSWNRDKPRPEGLYEMRDTFLHGYYLPVNFSQAALDTLNDIPKDDRPFLDNIFVMFNVDSEQGMEVQVKQWNPPDNDEGGGILISIDPPDEVVNTVPTTLLEEISLAAFTTDAVIGDIAPQAAAASIDIGPQVEVKTARASIQEDEEVDCIKRPFHRKCITPCNGWIKNRSTRIEDGKVPGLSGFAAEGKTYFTNKPPDPDDPRSDTCTPCCDFPVRFVGWKTWSLSQLRDSLTAFYPEPVNYGSSLSRTEEEVQEARDAALDAAINDDGTKGVLSAWNALHPCEQRSDSGKSRRDHQYKTTYTSRECINRDANGVCQPDENGNYWKSVEKVVWRNLPLKPLPSSGWTGMCGGIELCNGARRPRTEASSNTVYHCDTKNTASADDDVWVGTTYQKPIIGVDFSYETQLCWALVGNHSYDPAKGIYRAWDPLRGENGAWISTAINKSDLSTTQCTGPVGNYKGVLFKIRPHGP